MGQLADSSLVAGSRILPHLQKLASDDAASKRSVIDAVGSTADAIGSIAGKATAKDPVKLQSPVPPGLSLPQDFPPLAAPSRPPPLRKITQTAASNIKPAVPIIPTSKGQTATTAKDGQGNLSAQEQGSAERSDDTAVIAAESPADVELGKKSSTTDQAPSRTRTSNINSWSASDVNVLAVDASSLGTPHKATEKRQLPGRLDIAAAKDSSKRKLRSVATSSKPQEFTESTSSSRSVKESTDSQPDTPTKLTPRSAHSSRSNKPQPRTIRVVPTSKADSPAKQAIASPPGPESATNPSAKPLSRRPSLTFMQGPPTPISEKISDNASFTSTSQSRANSPPPSKVGIAPVRQNTKSQQKKERQTRAKQAETSRADEEPMKAVVEETVVQAPIIGRKKKAKKITASRGTADSTPAVTRPSSPTQQEEVVEEKLPSLPATPVKDPKKTTKRELSKTEMNSPATPDTPAHPNDPEAPKPALTAASVFASLLKSGDIPPTVENLFKSVAGMNYRFDITPADLKDTTDPILTAELNQRLGRGEPVHIELPNQKPVIAMPDGTFLRGLTTEQASRYMQLRSNIIYHTPEHLKWQPREEDIERLQLYRPTSPSGTDLATADEGLGELVNRFSDSPEMTQQAQPDQRTAWPAMYTDCLQGETGVGAGAGRVGGRSKEIVEVEVAEEAMGRSRKEHEGFEKRMNAVLKKNRRLLFGGGH